MKQALRQWTTSLFIIKHVHSAACLWWWQWTKQSDFSVSVITDCNSLLLSKQTQERVQALADISRLALCCHSNETCAPTTNPPNRAQLQAPYHSPNLHNSVGMWRGTDIHTDTRLWPIYISPRLRLARNVISHKHHLKTMFQQNTELI